MEGPAREMTLKELLDSRRLHPSHQAIKEYCVLCQQVDEAEHLRRKLNFYETEGDASDGWCGEHDRRFYEVKIDADGDDYDSCVGCERDALRKRVEELEDAAKELMWQGDVAMTGLKEFGQVRNFEALQLALDRAHNLIDTNEKALHHD